MNALKANTVIKEESGEEVCAGGEGDKNVIDTLKTNESVESSQSCSSVYQEEGERGSVRGRRRTREIEFLIKASDRKRKYQSDVAAAAEGTESVHHH
ncbi:Hypothetical predicted protein [Xyrichtys novacula]|uniref:Uncharacterized protein n=1 Tax=Xyrichtys novacula TaxID=13765 RepID=A0AAV1FP70_XYRNO|nr:Hypothetical predicted protein [Xyrichtys novacula]